MKKVIVISAVLVALFCVGAWGVYATIKSSMPNPIFKLYDKGSEKIVRYDKYGKFVNPGTPDYHYIIEDRKALAQASGEGVFPNTQVYKDPVYKDMKAAGRLEGDRWKFTVEADDKTAFYKWASLTDEDPGVKQFYTGTFLENAELTTQAIKSYYSVIVNFPKTISYTYWNTPWYPSKASIINIEYLTRKHPFLRMKLVDSDIWVENGFDLDPANDVFHVNPGRIVSCRPSDIIPRQSRKRLRGESRVTGKGNVKLIQYRSGDWQLIVDDKPFIVKAVAYSPTKIGESPDEGTLQDWSRVDYDKDQSVADAAYKAWVDKNRNNKQDPDEKPVGDFQLMKEMGANSVRIYDHEGTSNKEVLRDMYNRYGIRVIMGDLFGAYAVGSGMSWYRGTNYADPVQRERLKARVRKMVETHKNEPYMLMWMLGNETNYGVANSAKRFPRPFYEFANEVAKMIKEIDPNHPVALCNGDMLYLDIFGELCPDIDILGTNSYRGWHGFGFWRDVKKTANKPVLVTEFGAPAYWINRSVEDSEQAQADYHTGAWSDIMYNSAGYGAGNSLGGVVFEWVDEWWKAYEPMLHDTHTQWPGPVKGGWFFEEWLGLTSQGNGKFSPYMRQLRKGYYAYKKMWNPSPADKLYDLWYNIVINLSW